MKLIHAGDCLKRAQAMRSVNSRELAKITGTSPQQVLRWRSNANIKLHTLQLICLSLDMTIQEFTNL